MILRMPDYCKEFQCIADKCSDCCCIGWEIDIDDNTAGFYESVNGEFGERLKANITKESPKSFILGKNERCPFLNNSNLCDIIINLGEKNLCQICSDHPRYYEWFDGITEGGIGLCCEEAARIILSQTKPLSFRDREIPDEPTDEYDTSLFNCLFSVRAIIISHLENGNIPLGQRICNILSYGEKLQERTDNGDFSVPEIETSTFSGNGDFLSILEFLMTLEPIDDKWIPYLRSCSEMFEKVKSMKEIFAASNPTIEQFLQNIAVYFIWRYFLKGVFNGEFLSSIKLMAISIAVIGYLFACKWLENTSLSLGDCVEIAKNYSKEIEYCEENLDALADASYENECFSSKQISGLFEH